MSGALLVMAKEPRAGAVKTRLAPALSPEDAAAFYDAMLEDVLHASAACAAQLALAPYLLVAPAEACAAFEARAPAPFRVRPQRGEGLAARMENAAADVHGEGFAPLVLRGSDSPTLGAPLLREALRALAAGADLALAPDQGGGYVLAALRAPAPGVFDHPMSTSSVLRDTLACAERLGLRTAVVGAGFDVDTPADLARLAAARGGAAAALCPRSLAFLDDSGPWPADTQPGNMG